MDRPPHHSSVPRSAVWAEDASVVCGIAGAVLSMGTALATLWLLTWGVLGADDVVLGLVAAVDLALILLAVAFHHLAIELARPEEPVHRGNAVRRANDPPPADGPARA